jgi:hypothetical protein
MKKLLAILTAAAFVATVNLGMCEEKAKETHKCSEACKEGCKAKEGHKCSDACKDKCAGKKTEEKK